ncbi:MAG: restriction endonuclease [Verrucomicrobiaceae bacterium]
MEQPESLPAFDPVAADAFFADLISRYSSSDDQIIKDLVSFHPLTQFDESEYVRLLNLSLSLDVSEKKRVVDATPTLSQFQIDELLKVFREEQEQFESLRPKEGETISQLEEHKKTEWVALKELYIAELKSRRDENRRSAESAPTDAEVNTIQAFLSPYNAEIVRALARRPADIYTLTPRQFEVLMAEILNDLGWSIELTPESKDGGRDIIATIPFGSSKLLGLVECKRYSPDHKVGLEIVERFAYTVRDRDRASFGMLATSSYFTQGAWSAAQRHQWQMQLHDFDHICHLLKNYGHYKQDARMACPRK